MKRFYLSLVVLLAAASTSFGQFIFDVEVDPGNFLPERVVFPASPLKYQVLFEGQTDIVQTTETYGRGAGQALAKQWHDFIGFTPDMDSDDLGWVSVNHEMRLRSDSIGDGGGMTVFKVKRDPRTDLLMIVEQTLEDGRTGEFFNVDFVNTVGETGMNCGGIVGPDGSIWTAEEWRVRDNAQVFGWQRDTSDFVIGTGADSIDVSAHAAEYAPLFAGETIKRYQNLNYMVQIDPVQAKAVRKQYNWGRQFFEGGAVMPDNKTVYLGEDSTPGLFTKFVADTEGDFTAGKFFVFSHDVADATNGNWIEIDNTNLDNMLNLSEEDIAISQGASMFNRLEWVVEIDGKVYMAETGRSRPGSRWFDHVALGGKLHPHIIESVRARNPAFNNKPDSEVLDFVINGDFRDYYGRVLKYDPETDEVTTFLEGGPFFEESPEIGAYPEKHLSNPDGLSKLIVGEGDDKKTFMIVQEDLNQSSNGSVPAGISNRTCEMFLLDMSIEAPTVDDLIRIAIVPLGAEVTGAIGTPDGKTILANSQHPSTNNPAPYNNSLTFEITGWDFAVSAIEDLTELEAQAAASNDFMMYPNPVSRTLNFNQVIDAAIYTAAGQRIKVYRNVQSIDVTDLKKGLYLLKTDNGVSKKLVIE